MEMVQGKIQNYCICCFLCCHYLKLVSDKLQNAMGALDGTFIELIVPAQDRSLIGVEKIIYVIMSWDHVMLI